MAPRRGAKQAAAEQIAIAAANSNISPAKKLTVKKVAKKSKQAKAGTRHAKAADKHEDEVTDNGTASPVKKSRGRAKKVVMSPKVSAKPVKTVNMKDKPRKANKQETEENNAGEEVALQITVKKTRAKATTAPKKAGAAKKLPAKSKTTSAAKRSKKETAIENGAGDAENADDEEPTKKTRRRKIVEESDAPAAKSRTSKKRKNDTKNIENEQIIEKEQEIEPIIKRSRRANKLEVGNAIKVNQDVKIIKSKERTKKNPAKKADIAKPEASIEEKVETEEEESQNSALIENLQEKSVKKLVTKRKPNTITATESKSKKRKANPSANRKGETKTKQKKEKITAADEDEIISDVIVKNANDSTLELIDENDAKDNNSSGNDNINNSKEESMNKDPLERKPNLPEMERSATFLCL